MTGWLLLAIAVAAPWLVPALSPLAGAVVAAVTLAAAIHFWRGRPLPWPDDADRAGGWPLLALVLLGGAALRLVALDDYPAWVSFDEGQNAVFAGDLGRALGRSGYHPVMPPGHGHGTETGAFYAMLASLRLFGVSLAALRLPMALASLASIAVLFGLGRELFGRRVGLLAAAALALAPWPAISARVAMHSVAPPLFLAGGLWCLATAMRLGGRGRYLAAGLLLGLGLHTYAIMRFGLAVALLWTAVAARGDRPTTPLRAGLGWLLLGWALPALPIAVAAALDPMGYLGPLLLHEPAATGALERLGRGLHVCLFGRGAYAGTYSTGPAPSAALGLLLLAAVPLAARWRDRRLALLAVVLLVMAPPFLLARWHATHPRRFVGIQPAYFLLVGLACSALWDALPRLRRVLAVLGLLAAAGLAAETVAELRGVPSACPDPHREAILRAALREAGNGTTVALPAAFDAGWLPWAAYFQHPRVVRVDDDDLPRALARHPELLVVDHPPGLGRAAVALGGRAEPLTLPASCGGGTATAYRVRRPETTPARDAWLALPRGGPWRFDADVTVDGRPVPAGTPILRGAGLLRLSGPLAGLRWQGPDDPGPSAIPAAHWWPADTTPGVFAAPPLAGAGGWQVAAEQDLPRLPGARAQRVLDCRAVDGGVELLTCQTTDAGGRRVGVFLRRLDGSTRPLDPPLEHRLPAGLERHIEHLPPKAFRFAAVGAGRVVLARLAREVWLYPADGPRRAVPGPWSDPIDVVALPGGFAVADTDGRVVRFDDGGRPTGTTRHGRPVALAHHAGRLLVLDASGRVLVDGDRRIPQPLADDTCRLAPGPGGALILLAPASRAVRAYGPDLRLRLCAGTVDPLRAPGAGALHLDARPRRVGAAATPDGQLWLALDDGRLLRYAPGARALPPIDLPAPERPGGPESGLARWTADLPDGGRWEVWIELAAPAPAGLTVALDGQALPALPAGARGWTRVGAALAWPGRVELTVTAPGARVPTIDGLRLIRR